jgi:phosphoenolpyruvate synthase/pyruvate phosphate dikinase
MSGDKLILPLAAIRPDEVALAGGKGCALARLAREGIAVPFTLVVTTAAYRDFVAANGLQEKILLELTRKAFEDMRWEELWDAALRIRSMFLTHPLPAEIDRQLQDVLDDRFTDRATVVRSSAPQEDSAGASFAGIHESYVNVRGRDRIIDHVRRVWASLWSDGALLYRQELGLRPEASAMAVLVQELIVGTYSGVAFTVSPANADQSVVEAVPGLNQGLVDGLVTPERWILDRESGAIVSHTAADGTQGVYPGEQGVHLASLETFEAGREPFSPDRIGSVIGLARQVEAIFGRPQDVEWTMRDNDITVLQARPITTTATGEDDQRGWYLSLRRSYENLQALRVRIEEELIPAMINEAESLAAADLTALPDEALAAEVRRRVARNQHWSNVYWEDFIPYAHGARLFGQVYNDALKPDNPYEFIDLLTDTPMASMARNRHLESMAEAVRASPEAADHLRGGRWEHLPAPLQSALEKFVEQYGTLSSGLMGDRAGELADSTLVKLILALAARPLRERQRRAADPSVLVRRFIDAFKAEERDWARSILELARSSYRLRDDDNIHLGRIEAQVHRAAREAASRLQAGRTAEAAATLEEALQLVPQESAAPVTPNVALPSASPLKARQLVGQPAGPGVARGPARVVARPADLAAFQAGDILVCDAVDPNMTFVVPLAAAVVERRGGMLIHGAIIAREYGLPCVTGVPEALQFIQTGDRLTVDGYLGIVIIGGTYGRED